MEGGPRSTTARTGFSLRMSDKTYPSLSAPPATGKASNLCSSKTPQPRPKVWSCAALPSHRFDYARLLALNPRKVKLALIEKQPGNTIVMPVWVYPEVQEALRQRYPQNLMTTLCSLMTTLADPDTILIEGEAARALRDSGVTKGREIAGLGLVIQQLEAQVAEFKIREKVLAPFMAAITQAAGAGAGATQPAAAAAAQPVDLAEPYEQEARAATRQAGQPAAAAPQPRQSTGDPIMDAMLATTEEAPEPAFHGIPKPVSSGR